MTFTKTTEQDSYYNDLEKMTVYELLKNINKEDTTVPLAVEKVIPQIEQLVKKIVANMKKGGRLFYIGAGTSGRLGSVDASECPPTYGVSPDLVVGIMAGGDIALNNSIEDAEDDIHQGWLDLKERNINHKDVVIGIAASGTTPYVIQALKECNNNAIITGCITCNVGSPLAAVSKYPIEVVVGPEFVTGSSRMKAGTSQKLILNMISTSTMIQLGHVKGNKMVDMQLSNEKLVKRGIRMIMDQTGIESEELVSKLLEEHKSVRGVVSYYTQSI